MQLWRPESELDGTNSSSWYHCLPIGIYYWLREGGCIAAVCKVVGYTGSPGQRVVKRLLFCVVSRLSNRAFEWKMQFSCFRVLPDSTEALVQKMMMTILKLMQYYSMGSQSNYCKRVHKLGWEELVTTRARRFCAFCSLEMFFLVVPLLAFCHQLKTVLFRQSYSD